MTKPTISVELAYATPEKQQLVSSEVEPGTTIEQFLQAADLESLFPGHDIEGATVGVWGKPRERSFVLGDGDRVEVYRPLTINPREARRQLAEVGRTMRGEGDA